METIIFNFANTVKTQWEKSLLSESKIRLLKALNEGMFIYTNDCSFVKSLNKSATKVLLLGLWPVPQSLEVYQWCVLFGSPFQQYQWSMTGNLLVFQYLYRRLRLVPLAMLSKGLLKWQIYCMYFFILKLVDVTNWNDSCLLFDFATYYT